MEKRAENEIRKSRKDQQVSAWLLCRELTRRLWIVILLLVSQDKLKLNLTTSQNFLLSNKSFSLKVVTINVK